ALRGVYALEPGDAQAAGINRANIRDDADFVERACAGTIEDDDATRRFELGLVGRSSREVVAVFVVLKAAGSAAAVAVPIAISVAADNAVVVDGGNRVAEPLRVGGSSCPAGEFFGEGTCGCV